ncbi:hypothetical protein ACF0H5_003343 [Mactra antiquata]
MNPNAATSTPCTPITSRRQPSKRLRHERDSSSSVEDELSYLDLDTGRVMSSKRTADTITLSTAQFESIISKLSVLETCCSKLGKLDKLDNIEKLEKLDKLDNIESTLSTITSKITNIETRVTGNEHKISDIERSVEFVAKQYDTVVKVQSSSNSNSELRLDIEEIKSINHQLKEELLDLKCRNMRDNLIFIQYT